VVPSLGRRLGGTGVRKSLIVAVGSVGIGQSS